MNAPLRRLDENEASEHNTNKDELWGTRYRPAKSEMPRPPMTARGPYPTP